jgi:hypothetical protein
MHRMGAGSYWAKKYTPVAHVSNDKLRPGEAALERILIDRIISRPPRPGQIAVIGRRWQTSSAIEAENLELDGHLPCDLSGMELDRQQYAAGCNTEFNNADNLVA